MSNFWEISAAEQKLIFDQASARNGWVPSSIEKDYWVCYTLRHLFAIPELEGNLTFKGGTSLSKAWGLIDRFSEDIDLTIGRDALGFGGDAGPEQAGSNKQRSKRLKNLLKACAEFVKTIILPKLIERVVVELGPSGWSMQMDENDPDGQVILFEYPTHFAVDGARYVRPIVKIEFGARSDPWPAHSVTINPIIGTVFPALAINAINVHALAPERTFWEKAMLLHEERFRPEEKPRRARMARHYYDVFRLIDSGIAVKAAADIVLFQQVAGHREIFFPVSWVDYGTLRPETLEILPRDNQVDEWQKDYVAMQGEMFSITPPDFSVILQAVSRFQDEFRTAVKQPSHEQSQV